jgi:transglutaminase-like putative cysteine protease
LSRLSIRHETLYRFAAPVAFGVWRLMMRPLDTHATRLVEASLELSPTGETRWGLDAYGNSVCLYQPLGAAMELRVVNHLLIERYPAAINVQFDPSAMVDDEVSRSLVLSPYWMAVTSDTGADYAAWLVAHAPGDGEDRLAFVKRLNQAIHREIDYAGREVEGVQAPADTVRRGAGACRDVAWLMIEVLRRWGYAARFVSGYLYSPGGELAGAGATHAWCEVFFSGLGWIEFDPTNGIAESPDLIRVASTRTPAEAAPMRGTTMGPAQSTLSVSVDVRLAD